MEVKVLRVSAYTLVGFAIALGIIALLLPFITLYTCYHLGVTVLDR